MEAVCPRALAALLSVLVAAAPLQAAAQADAPAPPGPEGGAAFPVAPSEPIAPTEPVVPAEPAPPAAPLRVPPAALQEVPPPAPPMPKLPPDVPRVDTAEEQFEEQFIGFDDVPVVIVHDGLAASAVVMSAPYEGTARRPLVGVEFYRKLGRLDLVEAYESRQRLKTGLLFGGAVSLVASLAVGIATAAETVHGPDCGQATLANASAFMSCVQNAPPPSVNGWSVGVSVGLSLVGATLLGVGSAMDPNPVSPTEARRLAEQYNEALLQRLNPPPPAPFGPESRLRLEPRVFPGGGGLALGGTF